MKKHSLLLLALALTGCSSPVLERQHGYQVESITGQPLISGTHLSLTLDSDNRVYGNAGCNHFFGNYTLEEKALRFNQLASTRRLCDESVMQQERAFLDRLARNARWSVKDGKIKLSSSLGEPVMLVREKR
ncbi:META domain-containing protein [Pseudomonas matsuisoli]|uniref:META domain-containing protein n=1 Tax=Pseudomonas matsuisoli TaxID=1515666 RepID=A0A917UWW2_9PSED|nr:META domain-containing protein [Pseudomonas matsuisoli]GGJ90945.1 META domain-containing protein [Pseudomonas matsuisoli]